MRVIDQTNPAECGVSKQWIEDWWQQHQRKDEIRKRIAEPNATHVLHRMIEQEEDIEATAAPWRHGSPGLRDVRPTVPDGIRHTACYFGKVSVVKAFDPVKGRMIMRADLYYREAQQ